MEKYLKTAIFIVVSLVLILIGTATGLSVMKSKNVDSLIKNEKETSPNQSNFDAMNKTVFSDLEATKTNNQNADTPQSHEKSEYSEDNKALITAETKIIYEYVYSADTVVEKSEEMAPYFLLNLDEEKFRKYFTQWEIVSFSPEKILMRKHVDGESTQHYIIGEKDGFVAVFYKNEINGTNLKEITDTPITALSEGDRENLKAGVIVNGKEELLKMLENYTS